MSFYQAPKQNKEKQIHVKRILRKLMRLPEITIQNKFSRSRIAKLLEYIENFANQEIIEERPHDLKQIAKKRFTTTQQMLVKLVVLVVGSVVYSNTIRIYTASFGHLAWPAAIVGGFVASVGVDYLATEACSQYVRRQVTRRALNKLEKQKSRELEKGENNQFSRGFWDSKINFVHGVEGAILASSNEIEILGRKISVYILSAAVLNVIEFTGAFYLVSKLGLFDDLPTFIQLVISSLPVVITWMLAHVQAEWFHRSEYARELLRKYDKKVEGTVIESIDNIHKALVRLDAGIEAMLSRQSEYPTVELAELDADQKYWEAQIEELQERGKLQVKSLEEQSERAKMDFESGYQEFQLEEEELTSEEIEKARQSYETKKRQDLDDKFKKIESTKEKLIEQFLGKLQEELQELEIKRNLASKKFEQKKREFEAYGRQDDSQAA